jgi:hypothetical protein
MFYKRSVNDGVSSFGFTLRYTSANSGPKLTIGRSSEPVSAALTFLNLFSWDSS